MADDAERTEASLRHWKAESLRLRARLAEVEAQGAPGRSLSLGDLFGGLR